MVDCRAVGEGEKTLEYLSRYLYRGVLSERNIIADDDGQVTFAYREGKTGKRQTRTLPGKDFIGLVLRHVLPKGYRRVREYGFLHGNAKKRLVLLQLIFHLKIERRQSPQRPPFLCPECGKAMEILIPRVRHAVLAGILLHVRGPPDEPLNPA